MSVSIDTKYGEVGVKVGESLAVLAFENDPNDFDRDRRRIVLNWPDALAYDAIVSGPKHSPDAWLTVTDQETNTVLEVRRYPCGLGCKCDIQWKPGPTEAQTGAIDQALAELRGDDKTVNAKALAAALEDTDDAPVKIGDFFSASWGYDETNVDFYKVLGFTPSGKSVKVQRWSRHAVDDGHVMPGEGPHTDSFWIEGPNGRVRESAPAAVQTRRLMVSGDTRHITADEHYASLWDGKPEYQTPLGFGH